MSEPFTLQGVEEFPNPKPQSLRGLLEGCIGNPKERLQPFTSMVTPLVTPLVTWGARSGVIRRVSIADCKTDRSLNGSVRRRFLPSPQRLPIQKNTKRTKPDSRASGALVRAEGLLRCVSHTGVGLGP